MKVEIEVTPEIDAVLKKSFYRYEPGELTIFEELRPVLQCVNKAIKKAKNTIHPGDLVRFHDTDAREVIFHIVGQNLPAPWRGGKHRLYSDDNTSKATEAEEALIRPLLSEGE